MEEVATVVVDDEAVSIALPCTLSDLRLIYHTRAYLTTSNPKQANILSKDYKLVPNLEYTLVIPKDYPHPGIDHCNRLLQYFVVLFLYLPDFLDRVLSKQLFFL